MTRHCSAKSLWIIGLLALLLSTPSIASAAWETGQPQVAPTTDLDQPPESQPKNGQSDVSSEEVPDEGARAYAEALQNLQILYTSEAVYPAPADSSSSFLQSFLPIRYGPIAYIVRLASRLRQQSWIPWLVTDGGKSTRTRMRGRAIKVLDLLSHAVELGNHDALFKLAEVSMFPPPSMPMNLTRAYDAYDKYASLTGNAAAQSILAFFHGTGYGDIVPVDQSQALLDYTFAALGGDQNAEMALGYRHWAGIGVPDDCMTALDWYESAAERAMSHFLSGPAGGRTLLLNPTRLSDLAGGVYGPGSSVASTGYNANRAAVRAGQARAAGETWEEILEFYQYHTDQGELEYTLRLGKIYYHGTLYISSHGASSGGDAVGAVLQDYTLARQYFLRIARQVWPKDNVIQPTNFKREVEDRVALWAAQAAAYLGRMFLRGEGVKVDARYAKMWFERGAEYGDRECHHGLGIIWRDGLAGSKDDKTAIAYFAAAAGADLAEAQVQLGKYHLENGDVALALPYFDVALRHGSPFEAYYYLAHVHATTARTPSAQSTTNSGSCAAAVSFFKLVAERGAWKNDLMGEAERLWNSDNGRNKQIAILHWLIAAEMGYETAQNNLAYIFDKEQTKRMLLPHKAAPFNDSARTALLYWTRSAAQNNVDALVKVGDYHYSALGVPSDKEAARWEKAAGYYQSAVETQLSALAMWNLGWMYENGMGVLQDFHLAKRYYDLALETNREAYLPVTLSLIKLYLRSFWYTLLGGTATGMSLWDMRDKADDHWYLGKAKDEFSKSKRARRTVDGAVDEGLDRDDAVEWAHGRSRDLVRERDDQGDFGPDDYLYGRSSEAEDDASREFVETLVLLILCGVIAWLVYVRSQWAMRRAEEQRRRRDAGGQPNQPAVAGQVPPAIAPVEQ